MKNLSLLIVMLIAQGCGSRALPGGGDGSVMSAPDGAVRRVDPRCAPGMEWCGPAECGRCVPEGSGVYCPPTCPDARPPAPASNPCIIAIRIDDCCQHPVPVLAALIENDPCMVPYPAKEPIPAECLAKWRPECAAMDCAAGQPVSRVVVPVPGGGCAWADECQTDADCVLATNYTLPTCCPCPFGYPRQLLATNQCLVEGVCNEAGCPPPPPCPPIDLCEVPCVPCQLAPAICLKPEMPGGDTNRCIPWQPW